MRNLQNIPHQFNMAKYALLLLAVLLVFAPSYGTVHQRRYYIGGNKLGQYFEYSQVAAGAVVYRIDTWADNVGVTGVRLTYTSGTQMMAGKATGEYQGAFSVNYGAGERVTGVSIWMNCRSTRVGGFRIRTSNKREYFPRKTSRCLNRERAQDVGSGIILGAIGRHDTVVRGLGISMLRRIVSSTLREVTYDLNGSHRETPREKIAFQVTQDNLSGEDSDSGKKTVSKERTTGGSWSVTAGMNMGTSFTVQAGVPGIKSVQGTVSWEMSLSTTHERKWESKEGYSLAIACIVPKYSRVHTSVTYYESRISKLPFTARMHYVLDSGSVFRGTVRGVYDGVTTSRLVSKTDLLAVWNPNTRKWTDV